MGGHNTQVFSVEAENERSFGLAQPDRVLGQRLENGLEIVPGSTYNLKKFAGCGLLFPRLGEFVLKSRISLICIDFRRCPFAHGRSFMSLDRPSAHRLSALHH